MRELDPQLAVSVHPDWMEDLSVGLAQDGDLVLSTHDAIRV
jgi:hypothetical protein